MYSCIVLLAPLCYYGVMVSSLLLTQTGGIAHMQVVNSLHYSATDLSHLWTFNYYALERLIWCAK